MKKAKKAVKVADDEKDFAAVLNIITEHRSRALMSVNVESLLTYWEEIGAFLSPRIHSGSWSTAVVGKLADYIKRNQPELRGYGKSNLYNMALVYDSFSSETFLAVLDKYSPQLRKYNNIFQTLIGKSGESLQQGADGVSSVVKTAVQAVSPSPDFFQTAFGKSLPGILPRGKPHRGGIRDVAHDESGNGGAIQAPADPQGSLGADF